jgi:hypothetical protein
VAAPTTAPLAVASAIAIFVGRLAAPTASSDSPVDPLAATPASARAPDHCAEHLAVAAAREDERAPWGWPGTNGRADRRTTT